MGKLRITGGEPLVRRDLPVLIAELAALRTPEGEPVDLTLTTNGSALRALAAPLAEAGLQRITVSLDSLDDEVFGTMNGVDFPVSKVLDGIAAARAAGLAPIKVNTVVRRGMNEASVLPLARWARAEGLILRFIEYMDVGHSNGWRLDDVVPAAEILELIDAELPLEPVSAQYRGEVAGRYAFRDGSGEVGVIASVTRAVLRRLHACAPVRGRVALHVPVRGRRHGPQGPDARGRDRCRARRADRVRVVRPRRPLLRAPQRGDGEAAQGGDVRPRGVTGGSSLACASRPGPARVPPGPARVLVPSPGARSSCLRRVLGPRATLVRVPTKTGLFSHRERQEVAGSRSPRRLMRMGRADDAPLQPIAHQRGASGTGSAPIRRSQGASASVPRMATRERPGDRGRRQLLRDRAEVLRDLRQRRLAIGLSQAALAAATGVSRSLIGRIERDELDSPDFGDVGAIAAALGLRIRIGIYPEGQPVADGVQLRLLNRFSGRLAPTLRWRSEVPLPIAGDLRAWDAVVSSTDDWTGIEGISRLGAVDLTIRRVQQKQRDDPRVRSVVLVILDTTRNREAIATAGTVLRDAFPLDTAAVMRDLAHGRIPRLNGIVLLRVPRGE